MVLVLPTWSRYQGGHWGREVSTEYLSILGVFCKRDHVRVCNSLPQVINMDVLKTVTMQCVHVSWYQSVISSTDLLGTW